MKDAHLWGHQVADNQALSGSLSLGYNFHPPGFDYFTVGPGVGADHYSRNLNHFTYGHGGYFSPEARLAPALNGDFLTPEGQEFQVKGHLDLGYGLQREAASPCLPLGPAPSAPRARCADYPATRSEGLQVNAEIAGVVRINHHLQWGATFALRRGPAYDDTTALLFVRFFWEARPKVVSSDLPGGLLGTLY